MRSIKCLNSGWSFIKDYKEVPKEIDSSWEVLNLPHTWNNVDGQDGGNDYFRGTCCYVKKITKAELEQADCHF